MSNSISIDENSDNGALSETTNFDSESDYDVVDEIEKIQIDEGVSIDTDKNQIISEIMDISKGKVFKNRIKDKCDHAVAEKV